MKLPPFQAATKLPTWPTLEDFLKLGSKNNRNCPPLSTLSIHHDTPCLHQQAFLPPMARTHENALSTKVTQNRMTHSHHLSKALLVSLMKNHYSNGGFCRGKRKTLRSGGFLNFDMNLINHVLYKHFPAGDFLVLKPFPGDPILDHPDFRDPLLTQMQPRFPY